MRQREAFDRLRRPTLSAEVDVTDRIDYLQRQWYSTKNLFLKVGAMQETELAGPAESFLQGDILEMVDEHGERADPPYGIVINADCDLAHCKIDGVISYIPVFPFETYFVKFWIPAFADLRRKELVDAIAQRCALKTDLNDPLCEWLKEETADAVAQKISSTYSVKLHDLKDKMKELSLIVNTNSFDWGLLETLISQQQGAKDEVLARYAKRALKNLGDGHFFLNEIHGLSNVGFVARMRRIYSVDAECIFPSRSEFISRSKNSPLHGVRIAKLTNLYRFKVAQLFALQYSRIGLPDEITSYAWKLVTA
jgi:hypothetical protein